MSRPFRILTCQGIGDSVWTAFKAKSIAKAHGYEEVELLVGGWHRDEHECRALPFLRSLPDIVDARFYKMPPRGLGPMLLEGPPADEKGRFRYIPDGKPPFWLDGDVDFVAVPNRALENGIRLENWLPEYEINWRLIPTHTHEDGDYVVFFLGSRSSNGIDSRSGHNRSALWTPQQWAQLGDSLVEEGTKILVVGAGYDASYYEEDILPLVKHPQDWDNRIGEFSVLETLRVCEEAAAVVSFQSGIGIMAYYLHTPTVMWWRPEGDSISTNTYVSFDEKMASAWIYPKGYLEWLYKPCIYGRESVEEILEWLIPFL